MSTSSIHSGKLRNPSGTRRLLCSDVGTVCGATFEGTNDDKIVTKAMNHLAQDHEMPLTVELAARVRRMIKSATPGT
jgi:predicted small metal-binding protein